MVNFLKKYDITIDYTEEIDNMFAKYFILDYRRGGRLCAAASEFHKKFHEFIKYDAETGEFYVFTKKWEIDHDLTCVSKYLIHNFQCFLSNDFTTASQLYKKYLWIRSKIY